jgi:DNA polymerase III gamma/tau subunit
MEVAGSADDMDDAAKANMAGQLAGRVGVSPDRIKIDIMPMVKVAKTFFQIFLLQAGDADKMKVMITILPDRSGKGGPPPGSLAESIASMPVDQLSSVMGVQVLSAPKVITLEEERQALEAAEAETAGALAKRAAKIGAATQKVTQAESELQTMQKTMVAEREKSKLQSAAAKQGAKKALEEAEAKKAEIAANEVKMMKKIAAKEKVIDEQRKQEKAEKDSTPPPGAEFISDVALMSRERITGGQPCKILIQETEEAPWELREFRGQVACSEGFMCGKTKDIAAISYFQSGSEVSQEMSAFAYYCSKAGTKKDMAEAE